MPAPVKLFVRRNRAPSRTAEGLKYLPAVRLAFDTLNVATSRLSERPSIVAFQNWLLADAGA